MNFRKIRPSQAFQKGGFGLWLEIPYSSKGVIRPGNRGSPCRLKRLLRRGCLSRRMPRPVRVHSCFDIRLDGSTL